MKARRPLIATLSALGLTVVAAGSALAVNIGILSQQSDSAVGTLDTASSVAAEASQPTTRVVTVYVDDPSLGLTPAQQAAQQAVPTTVNADQAFVGDGAYEHEQEYEYEGADDDD
jgi:uncharacterized membrane protein